MKELIAVKQLQIRAMDCDRILVKKTDFSLAPGESLVILGQSGCGKTMTCRSLMGLLDPKRFSVSGEIIYNGKNILDAPPEEKRRLYGGEIAFIPQNPMTALDPSVRTGRQMSETLALHSRVPRDMRKQTVIKALKDAGLADADRVMRCYPHELSGGMLQRVLIAMVLMVNARLVIADEPTTALDVIHRNETVDAFSELRRSGTAILMVTHDFAAASRLGGDMVIMNEGEIIESGTVCGILSDPVHSYTRQLIDASALTAHAGR